MCYCLDLILIIVVDALWCDIAQILFSLLWLMLCDVVLPRSTSSWRRPESSELVIRSLTLNMSSHRAEGDLNPVVNFAIKYTYAM